MKNDLEVNPLKGKNTNRLIAPTSRPFDNTGREQATPLPIHDELVEVTPPRGAPPLDP
jgi:hypothetical protein